MKLYPTTKMLFCPRIVRHHQHSLDAHSCGGGGGLRTASQQGNWSLGLLILLLFLQACSVTSVKHTGPVDAAATTDNVDALLRQAAQVGSPQRDMLYVQAAQALFMNNQYSLPPHALALLFEVHADQLDPYHLAIYSTRYGQWALQHGQTELAQRLFDSEALRAQLPHLDQQQAIVLHQLRIELFLRLGAVVQAIDEHMILGSLLVDTQQHQENQNALWHLLLQLSQENQDALKNTSNRQLLGWLALQHIATATELDLDEQVAHLESWLKSHPRHPAAQSLPAELQILLNAQRDRPQHITLLLPLSGPLQSAGEAVRDGLLAAYYQSLARGQAALKIDIVDSQSTESFLEIYQQVARSGTELIIGPLAKDLVGALKNQGRLPVPTLALNNYSDENSGKSRTIENLFFFSLDPEDEARQVAKRARQDHHQRAVVIVPDSDWGQRVSNAFISAWLQREDPSSDQTAIQTATPTPQEPALVLASARFDAQKENYSAVVQQVLGIEDSKNRYGEIRWWSTEDVEFEPRRRQDIDMIFLAARPEQARQIKPLLAFHYAGQVPVYASSSVFSGEPAPDKDQDLNGLQLLVPPWALKPAAVQENIQQQLKPSSGLLNLYAMGADAWRLSGRLSLLASDPEHRLHGHSGILHMNERQQVIRDLLWAKMHRGLIAALPGSM